MTINKKEIGARIKNIRQKKGLTMEQFGDKFNASKGVVSNWESGRNIPNNERLKEIAKAGNVSTDYILTGEDYKQINLDVFKDLDKMENTLNRRMNNQDELEIMQEKIDDLASLVEDSPSSEAIKKISSMYNNKSEKAKRNILSEVQNIDQFKNFELISLNWHIILLKMYNEYPGVATNLSSLAHFVTLVKDDLENPTEESLTEKEIIEGCQRHVKWMIESITKEKDETE